MSSLLAECRDRDLTPVKIELRELGERDRVPKRRLAGRGDGAGLFAALRLSVQEILDERAGRERSGAKNVFLDAWGRGRRRGRRTVASHREHAPRDVVDPSGNRRPELRTETRRGIHGRTARAVERS
jgi:hypothetical protein